MISIQRSWCKLKLWIFAHLEGWLSGLHLTQVGAEHTHIHLVLWLLRLDSLFDLLPVRWLRSLKDLRNRNNFDAWGLNLNNWQSQVFVVQEEGHRLLLLIFLRTKSFGVWSLRYVIFFDKVQVWIAGHAVINGARWHQVAFFKAFLLCVLWVLPIYPSLLVFQFVCTN